MKDTVLIVDDMEINRAILREILKADYDILEAANGREALDIIFSSDPMPRAVLLDIIMPEMDGFQVLEQIKTNWRTENIAVLFITAADATTNESRGLKMGAVDYIAKPFNPDVVKARVDNSILLLNYQANLESMVERKTQEMIATHERMMESMASIIEYRSLESGTHVRRTVALTEALVDCLLDSSHYAQELLRSDYPSMIKAASLHDIGKIGIPDNVLLKPGRLTPEEFEVIKTHTVIGEQIIDSICASVTEITPYLRHCRDICRSHHERWDGGGYPDGRSGEEIPLSARILSLVDVYDALSNPRCYKPAYTHEKAIEIISEGRGTQFDPVLVDAALMIQENFRQIQLLLADPIQEMQAAK